MVQQTFEMVFCCGPHAIGVLLCSSSCSLPRPHPILRVEHTTTGTTKEHLYWFQDATHGPQEPPPVHAHVERQQNCIKPPRRHRCRPTDTQGPMGTSRTRASKPRQVHRTRPLGARQPKARRRPRARHSHRRPRRVALTWGGRPTTAAN